MSAVKELLYTLFNELTNNDWLFENELPDRISIDDLGNAISLYMPDGQVLSIQIAKGEDPGYMRCPECQKLKPGWPDGWRNDPTDLKRTRYLCGDCVSRQKSIGSPNG